MRRVMVVGGSGAGKSTFARALGDRTGLPVVHMDRLFWEPGWVMTPEETFRARVSAAIAEDTWVMDGNYSRTWPERLARADTGIFLDLSTGLRLWRVMCRIATSHGRTRPDMAEDCPEQLDPGFVVKWVGRYRWRSRPGALALLSDDGPAAQLARHWLTSPAAARRFLDQAGSRTCGDTAART